MEYTQDMINKIDAQITKDVESGKSINQIEKEIKAKLNDMKPNKISSVYNASDELVKIVDKVDKLKAWMKEKSLDEYAPVARRKNGASVYCPKQR